MKCYTLDLVGASSYQIHVEVKGTFILEEGGTSIEAHCTMHTLLFTSYK